MGYSAVNPALPKPLRVYIGLVGVAGMGLMVYLAQGAEWSSTTLAEAGLFIFLIVVAGSFPLPVAPRVKADVTTAVWFSAALLLEAGVASPVGAVAVVIYTLLVQFWGERLKLPWYKYPFNAGQVALLMGLTSLVFHWLLEGDSMLTPAVVPAAVAMYMVNTALVSVAASLQIGVTPLRIWWVGTVSNGLAELSLLAFGFLGAVAYRESPWTVVALFIPVAVIYIAFSRLARTNTRLGETVERVEALQGRIVGTSKLASIGALSLDLAHQIKNPLAILLGRLEGLQDRLDNGSPARAHLDIALDAGWRIQEITQTFASIGQQKWVRLDMGELLDEAFGMAGLRNRKSIETRCDYQRGLIEVQGNPVLIREAVSNIFCNAMDAVAEGGTISVSASRVYGSVVVSISDNGVGIPADEMDRAFEPFATTKPHGHGLGLFAARHILEMHRGRIEVQSVEGDGTCVTMSLPAALPSAATPEESSDSLPSVQSR